MKGPVLVHVITKKGDGYEPAERHPARFHGTAPFDIATGIPLKKQDKANYTDVFSSVISCASCAVSISFLLFFNSSFNFFISNLIPLI